MHSLFYDKQSFNEDIGNWDVSQVTTMQAMFMSTSAFNQDISGWDISNVVSMSGMFDHATAFNQDISGWDVSSAGDFGYMFYEATSFNQSICWDLEYLSALPATTMSMYDGSGCPQDSFLARDCSATNDVCGVCAGDGSSCVCQAGTFSANGRSVPNACADHTSCANGYAEATPGTTTQDRTCQYDNFKPTDNTDLQTQVGLCDGKWDPSDLCEEVDMCTPLCNDIDN